MGKFPGIELGQGWGLINCPIVADNHRKLLHAVTAYSLFIRLKATSIACQKQYLFVRLMAEITSQCMLFGFPTPKTLSEIHLDQQR